MDSPAIHISEIWIYPIKSLAGISLKSSLVLPKGLEFDRRFMLVNSDGVALTQREHSRMALFRTQIVNEHIVVTWKDDSVTIPLRPTQFIGERQVEVWGQKVAALEIDASLNAWFCGKLNLDVRLIYFPEENPRPVDENYKIGNEHVSLADAYPILIIGQKSLDDLNARLAEPLPMKRFRPNLVFTGADAFIEDTWRSFKIGENEFAAVKPCARCVLTTVDPDTGIKGPEPLRTLSKFRSLNNKVYFGQNVLVLGALGTVNVGDSIEVQSFKSELIMPAAI